MSKTQEPGITRIEGVKGSSYRVQIRIKNGEHLSKNFETFKEAKEWKRKTITAVKSGDLYRHTTLKNMAKAGLFSGFLIQALRELGKENITTERIEHLKGTIPLNKRRELLKDIRLALEWMHSIFKKLAEKDI